MRRSVRTYNDVRITEEVFDKILKILGQTKPGPFGNTSKFHIIKLDKPDSLQGVDLGTYGYIKGHMAYLVGVCNNQNEALVDLGYSFEKIVLEMTRMGLGTCWMGGTFDRASFAKFIELDEGEFIGAVSPLGYAADKQRFRERTIRKVIRADNRKPWEHMFFSNDFGTPLDPSTAGNLAEAFKMVRLGPSASNKQPWRLVLEGNTTHFYLDFDEKYSGNTKFGYPIQRLDIGIAMRHFKEACRVLGRSGNWTLGEPDIKKTEEQPVYIISFKLD